jgi:hypothetical protein
MQFQSSALRDFRFSPSLAYASGYFFSLLASQVSAQLIVEQKIKRLMRAKRKKSLGAKSLLPFLPIKRIDSFSRGHLETDRSRVIAAVSAWFIATALTKGFRRNRPAVYLSPCLWGFESLGWLAISLNRLSLMSLSLMNQPITRLLTIAFCVVSVVLRLLPHPPNVDSVASLAVFAGCYLAGWQGAILAVGVMAVSDQLGSLLNIPGMGFYDQKTMISVYLGLAVAGFVGRGIRGRVNYSTVPAAAITSAVLFFLITNFACWLDPLMMYPRTAEGLVACYTNALAFIGNHNLALNTLVGNLVFTTAFFVIHWKVCQLAGQGRLQPQEVVRNKDV